MESNGSPAPVFYTDEQRLSFSTTLYIHPEFDAKNEPTPTETPTEIIQESLSGNKEYEDKYELILNYCKVPRTRQEIQEFMGLRDKKHFLKTYVNPLLQSGKLQMTEPDNPNNRNQRYIAL